MDGCNPYKDYEEEYDDQLFNRSLVNETICKQCVHLNVCYMYKNINEGKKYYQDYFGEGVMCPDFIQMFRIVEVNTDVNE